MSGQTSRLEDIPGIGRITADRLREVGVESIGSLANADAEQLHESLQPLSGITLEKVVGWIDDARKIQPGASSSPRPGPKHAFLVKLTADADGRIVRTTVESVSSKQGSGWDGWAPDEIVAFIESEHPIDLGGQRGAVTDAEIAEAMEADEIARASRRRKLLRQIKGMQWSDVPVEAGNRNDDREALDVEAMLVADQEARAGRHRESLRRRTAGTSG